MDAFFTDNADLSEVVRRELGKLVKPDVLSMQQVADELQTPLSTLEAIRKNGLGGRFFRIGRRVYIRRVDLDAWLTAMVEEFPAQDRWLGGEAADGEV